jgi:hypothetical protein
VHELTPALRVAAFGAGAFDVLYLGHRLLQGFGAEGSAPPAIIEYAVSHRTALLVREIFVGLALLAAIAFVAALATALRVTGQGMAASAVAVSGAVFVVIGFLSQSAETALVHVSDAGDRSAALALNELQGRAPVVWTIIALTATVSWGATRSGFVPRWFGAVGLAAALVFLLGGVFSVLGRTSESSSSLFGVGLFVAWMLALTWFLWRASRTERHA